MATYDQHDIKAILNRAVELQQRSSGSGSISKSTEKLSLSEIEEIARDAGVSPDYVREAAMEYEGIPVEEPLFLDTGDFNKVEVLGFAKGSLDKRTWAELRSMIEYHFDSPGKVTRRPNGIHWKAQPKGILKFLASKKSPEVEIKTENNRSTISIQQSLKTTNKFYLPALASFLSAMFFFTLGLVGELGSDVGPALMIVGLLLGLSEILRRWVKRKKNKKRKQLQDLMHQLQSIVTRRHKTLMQSNAGQQIQIGDEAEENSDQGEIKNSRNGKNKNNQ